MSDGRSVALVLGTSTGGVGAHVLSLAGGLKDRGWQVTVCGPTATDELFGFSGLGVGFAPVQIAGLASDPAAVLVLRRATRRSALVHAHGLRAGTVAAIARRHPLVVSWHNAVLTPPGWRRRLLAVGEGLVARSADVTLVASEDLGLRVRELGGHDVRAAPVAAPQPVPLRGADEVRRELGLQQGEFLVVCVGRLHEQKSLDVLIRASVEWRDLGAVVVIAGDGPERTQLQVLIERTDAPVRLLGRRGDVPDLLGAADVVVLSSKWEARSLAAQEAMTLGRPLVATRVGGMPELVGEGAVLTPPGDVDALVAAVRTLLTDPQAGQALGQRATAQAATWPHTTDVVDQISALYDELLGVAR